MKINLLFKPAVAVAVMAMFGAAANGALAAGFALNEQSVSGLGVAFAGGAASGEDASTVFYNPAAMTRISGTQAVVGIHGILPDASFTNQGSFTVGGPLTGSNGGDLAKSVGVPNFYLVTDINPNIKYGFGISVPFGLTTAYDGNWVGRYQALKSEIKTVNLNPSLAYKVNDRISVGAGFNAQYINAELSNALDFSTICLGQLGPAVCGALGLGVPQTRDGAVNLSGNDWSFGYNLGVLFQLPTDTRVGLAYRSKVHQTIVGNASFTNVPAAFATNPRFQSGGIKASVTLPDSMSLSVVQGVGDRWELLSDVTFTRWSYFNELRVHFDNGVAPDAVTVENWRNTFRASIGATYRYSDALKLRGGIGFDQSPVRGAFRTARIPDNHRKLLAAGANYKVSKAGSVDFAYLRLFANDSAINNKQLATGGGQLIGNYTLDVNILSLQYNHNF